MVTSRCPRSAHPRVKPTWPVLSFVTRRNTHARSKQHMSRDLRGLLHKDAVCEEAESGRDRTRVRTWLGMLKKGKDVYQELHPSASMASRRSSAFLNLG